VLGVLAILGAIFFFSIPQMSRKPRSMPATPSVQFPTYTPPVYTTPPYSPRFTPPVYAPEPPHSPQPPRFRYSYPNDQSRRNR
jgi:hypothetical protein